MTDRLNLAKHSRELYQAMRSLDTQVRNAIDPVLGELLYIRASQLNGCAFCIDLHTQDARAAGETEQRIYALNAWRETPFFTPAERAALALCEAVTFVHDGHVPDQVYEQAAQHFERSELAAVIWASTMINTLNRIAITSRTTPATNEPHRRNPSGVNHAGRHVDEHRHQHAPGTDNPLNAERWRSDDLPSGDPAG